MAMNEQPTPTETIRTALHCADGECAIDEPDYRRALAWLDDTEANLATKGGADKATLARKLRRKNTALREMQEQRDALTEALRGVEWLPGPHTPHNGALECPECGQGQYQGHMGDCLIGAVLAAMPAELLARRQQEQAIVTAAIAYRDADRAHRMDIFSREQKERNRTLTAAQRALYAAVDGLKETKGDTNAVPT